MQAAPQPLPHITIRIGMKRSPAPAAYQATGIIDGDTFGAGQLLEPNDLHVTEDQKVYILDSGNNRVSHDGRSVPAAPHHRLLHE